MGGRYIPQVLTRGADGMNVTLSCGYVDHTVVGDGDTGRGGTVEIVREFDRICSGDDGK